MNRLDMESKNIVSSNIEKIKKLFPSVITEIDGKEVIDFDSLKQELSDVIFDEKKERYQLTWPGKKEAIVNANTPSKNTLRPLKEKSMKFENTKNVYIEGDNLEVLKILQESYLNKIDCIYIDPPYNTGNDFIYNDRFEKDKNTELEESGQLDDKGFKMISNTEGNGRFHSDWLSMMYSRIKLARNLLAPSGFIFISIDDNEQSNLKKICDEIFGESNFVANFTWVRKKKGSFLSNNVRKMTEYILCYRKDKTNEFKLYGEKAYSDKYQPIVKRTNNIKRLVFPSNIIKTGLKDGNYNAGFYGKEGTGIEILNDFIVENSIIKNKLSVDGHFTWQQSYLDNEIKMGTEITLSSKFGFNVLRFDQDKKIKTPSTLINSENGVGTNEDATLELQTFFELAPNEVFSYSKPTSLIKYLLNMVTYDKTDAIILDFFSGSATTAQAVMELNSDDNKNLKYIMVQLPESNNDKFETICEFGEERIRRASKKIKEDNNSNIDYGFRVYKVDSSNMKDVFYKPGEISQTNLFDMMSNIKEDRTSEDLLTQVILDLGLTLDLKIEEKIILNNKVYFVADNALVACFDDKVNINIIDEICKCNPLKVVFKDNSFKTDKDKINLEERVKKLSPDTEISIL